MKKDLVIVGLLFVVIVILGVNIKQYYQIKYLEKDLKNTTQVVYWLSDKLDTSYTMVDSLNEELTIVTNELDDFKKKDRLLKDLVRDR